MDDQNIFESQLSIFDFLKEKQVDKVLIKKPLRLIELFAGYGSQAMAFKKLGIPIEHHFVCEFDKYAIKSYNKIHNTDFEPIDIRQVNGMDLGITNTDQYCYFMTYSFPCTDLSVAGKMAGMSKEEWEKGNSTKSGLLWEVERLLKQIVYNNNELPQILFMENVKQVIGKGNMQDFQKWLDFLESIGYYNTYKVLNAKHYGVAQNRERCFMFSFLKSEFGEQPNYEFPEPFELNKRLKDYLEDDIPDNMYIKTEKAENLLSQLIENGTIVNTILRTEQNRIVVDGTINNPKEKQAANCIKARYDSGISNLRSEGNVVIETSMFRNRKNN